MKLMHKITALMVSLLLAGVVMAKDIKVDSSQFGKMLDYQVEPGEHLLEIELPKDEEHIVYVFRNSNNAVKITGFDDASGPVTTLVPNTLFIVGKAAQSELPASLKVKLTVEKENTVMDFNVVGVDFDGLSGLVAILANSGSIKTNLQKLKTQIANSKAADKAKDEQAIKALIAQYQDIEDMLSNNDEKTENAYKHMREKIDAMVEVAAMMIKHIESFNEISKSYKELSKKYTKS